MVIRDMDRDPYAAAKRAASVLRDLSRLGPVNAAVILGSGWRRAADALGDPCIEISMTAVPGFPKPTVEGHGGSFRFVRLNGLQTLVALGRVHGYEGHTPAVVVHGIRVAAALGCRTVILTNAAGSLRTEWQPGQLVLLADHLNLTGRSPIIGARFVDLTDLYSEQLRRVLRALDCTLPEGVYAGVNGPSYETPAEVRMLRALGADLVGMSTVLEAIAAREAGMRVLGISLVTNLAAGQTGEPIDHSAVLRVGAEAGPRVGEKLAALLHALAETP